MRVGLPRGLLYEQLHPFFHRFFYELGAEIVLSPPTNRTVLDEGVKYCVNEACLPIKVFHGHAASIRKDCDLMLIPRIMQLKKGEFICPKFCGLPEMIKNSIPDMPEIIDAPYYATSPRKMYKWARKAGGHITSDKGRIRKALSAAQAEQRLHKTGISNEGFKFRIALAGHPYNIYDNYVNMNIVRKLNKLSVGVMTEESIDPQLIDREVKELYKKPFWTFARKNYGFAVHVAKTRKTDGIIYVSSFACGIDSVIVELIRNKIGDFPFLILKMDEHTGEAGLETRIEAFVDLLERSGTIENNLSPHGECLSCGESPV